MRGAAEALGRVDPEGRRHLERRLVPNWRTALGVPRRSRSHPRRGGEVPNTIRGLLVVVAAGFLVLGVRDIVLCGWFGWPVIVIQMP